MKERTLLKTARLIAITMAVLVILLAITACGSKNGPYSISFDGLEIPMENVSVKAGEVPIIPAVPQKDGYAGVWTLDGQTFDTTAAFEYGKDITLLASYTPITYKVTFKADGVQVGEPLTYNVENKTITAPAVPEKAGYNGAWESYSLTIGDVTVNAVYTAKGDTKYTVEHYIENDVGEYELHSSENLTGKTGTTATANAITIENYVAKESVGFGQIAGDGSLVIKFYYDIVRFQVTFDYDSGREDTVVTVKYGEAVSRDAATLDSRTPYTFLGWMKDGEAYDFATPVTENITLVAAYENEHVFEDAEGELKWIVNKSSLTLSAITGNGVISGNQSMQVTIDGTYRGIYKMNLDSIDFTNVNYIYLKAKVDTSVRFSVRFLNSNDPYGTYIQYATDVAADGKWQTICIDMNSLFTGTDFGKDSIKTIFILCDKATTLTLDDIVFVNDKSLYKQDIIAHYDFETAGAWSSTGTGNTFAYITEGGINGQSLQANVSAWNGLFNTKVAGMFTDVNYVYLKLKGVSSNPYLRLYATTWVSNDFYLVTGITVETKGDYRIVRYDISDLSLVETRGSADFGKSAISTMFVGSLSTASTFVIDDLTLASVELNFPPEVVFKADGVTVGIVNFAAGDVSVNAPDVPEKAGYTGVWESYVLGDSDIVVNAIYTPITYTATFVADGVNVGTVNFTVADTSIAAPDVPEKAGFNGVWESYTIIADNITVNAIYTEKTAEYTVTFVYGGAQANTTVKVEDGATVSADAATLDPKYPFAFIEWQKDGVKFDFATAITEDITLTAVYANEYVYDDFETEGKWNTSNATTVTYTHITSGALSGKQSLQFTAPQYGAIYRQNLNTSIDFTDVNYIFVKLKVDANAKITFRFLNTNGFAGTQVQIGQDIIADGGWHIVCIDMNSLFNGDAAFGKDAIKSFILVTGAATTVTLDDIVFVNDKSLYKQEITSKYDFETQGGWSATGTGNTFAYITEGGINGQSLQATLTAWNGLFNTKVTGLLTDANYIYLKVGGVNTNPTIRLYKDTWTSTNYYQVSGVTVATKDGYRIVRYDIRDLSTLTVKGTADYGKNEINSIFIGGLSTASTFVIDDLIFAGVEVDFPLEVVFKADGVTVGTVNFAAGDVSVTAPDVPEKAGYTGVWESYVLGDNDVVVNAIYTPITYTATFVADGVTVGTVNFTVADTSIAAPDVPEKEGFNGVWESYTIIADNITVNAIYTEKTAEYTVTFVYGGAQANTTVKVAGGATVSADAAALDAKYPFAFVEWQKDGVKFDFATPITEDTTLTAVYANEYVYDDFETEGSWNTTGTNISYTHIQTGAISGSQSLQFTAAAAYQAINRQNLTDKIDFTDVNYIFVKVRVSANAKVTFRFVNTNAFSGTQVQIGYDIKADGGWHTICIDMNAIFNSDAAFGKDAIKSFVIMAGSATTVTIDDIVFVNDKSLYKQETTSKYDFETEGGWSATGAGNTATYITDGAINGQSVQATLTAWNGLVNQNAAGLFADTNYVYLKIKGVSANPYIRLYKSIGISNDYYTLIGTTVATVDDYRIVRFDISDWSQLTVKGAANFTKAEVNTMFFGSLSTAATFVVDDLILSSTELTFE